MYDLHLRMEVTVKTKFENLDGLEDVSEEDME